MRRPLPRSVRAAMEILAPLVAAIPRAWAIDRVFRFAVLAAVLALATLCARPLVDRSDRARPTAQQQQGQQAQEQQQQLENKAASSALPLPPPGARYAAPDLQEETGGDPATQTPTGPIAPGRALDGLRVDPDPDATPDPFGTPGAADPSPRKTP